MKLTPAQLKWLQHAQARGYEHPFVNAPTPALTRLERLGLIERDPSSLGRHTRWRVTAKGARAPTGRLH